MITSLKFLPSSNSTSKQNSHVLRSILLFSSSRDRTVKMWRIQYSTKPTKTVAINLEQTIEGHVHSVWDVDCTSHYLVAGSADKSIRVWKNSIDEETESDIGKII